MLTALLAQGELRKMCWFLVLGRNEGLRVGRADGRRGAVVGRTVRTAVGRGVGR